MSNFEKFDLRDGTHIRFTKTGKGEPLLLLHTIRNRLEYFDLVIPYLKDNYTVYAIDLPGFGDSPVNKNTNYDQSFMTDVVIDFIEQNDLSNVTLAGESIGGVLPLTVANKISNRINKIFSFNPYDYDKKFGDGVRRGNLIARFIIWSMSLPMLGNFFSMLESKIVLWLIFMGGVHNKSAITNRYLSILTSSIWKSGNLYHLRNVFLNFHSWTEAKKVYKNIKVPIKLIYGKYDWSNDIERNETMHLLGLNQYITLDNVGHFSFLEAPEKIAEIINKV